EFLSQLLPLSLFWHWAAAWPWHKLLSLLRNSMFRAAFPRKPTESMLRDIIGFFVDSAGKQHGFLHQGATFTQLDFPGATATRTVSINNAGVIAGSFTDAAGVSHGLTGRPGAFTRFDFPGSTSTLGLSINDSGTLAGLFNDAAGQTHAFVKQGDTFQQFDFPGGHNTIAFGINNL